MVAMSTVAAGLCLALALGCSDPTCPENEPLRITAVSPTIADPLGGSRLVISGTGLTGATVRIAGLEVEAVALSDGLALMSPPLPPGEAELEVLRCEERATAALRIWSPAELPGARLFDAAAGVNTSDPGVAYEWQRMATDVHPDWRIRDGNTLTWFPQVGRFFMVGGWNGYREPDGFSPVEPGTVHPPLNTTNEVWSSPDAIAWTLELPHDHDQFQRRHAHNTIVWKDRLWVIGGDAHQGFDNHDVLSSADGVTWVEELPPGAPPWAPRSLQFSGVFGGRLWTGGGQTLIGPEADYVFHNDLWVSDDGRSWTQVLADAPPSTTRWAGCSALDGLVEWRGELWLVGCARYYEAAGHELIREVWSSPDGVSWRRRTTPPWPGRIWHNALVWDGRLWVLFGYTTGDPALGWPQDNSKEAWFTDDGERWHPATWPDSPVPGSHAQGVAVTDDALWLVGGNHTFLDDDTPGRSGDTSIWRMQARRGLAVSTWRSRGLALEATATGDARPTLLADAFGKDRPGLFFDGSRSMLSLASPDAQPDGRTVLWVGRFPHQPAPWGWEETYAPNATIIGGVDQVYPNSSIGLSRGRLVMVNREAGSGPAGEPLWARLEAGQGLQEGPGEVRLVGLTHEKSGAVTAWIDGQASDAGRADYAGDQGQGRSYSRLGGSQDDTYYGPNTRFQGTLGAILVLPSVADEATVSLIHAWAQGRFGAR